jgi:Ca-activated chloride channel family protein
MFNKTKTTTSGSPTPDVTGGGLSARTDRCLIPTFNPSERHILVQVTAPTVRRTSRRAPANLAYVLDRSGSMSGWSKLALAKQAVTEAIARQDSEDGFAVVVYDNEVIVTTSATSATPLNRHAAAQQLAAVQARGGTNLAAGWLAGCEQLATRMAADGVNRVLLLTDGLANIGITAPEELARMAADLRTRGITTSTFGVGADFDERLLQSMADAGGGHFYFIGDVAQMRDHITSEAGEALDIAVRGAVLEVVVPHGVIADTLSPYRTERVGNRLLVHLGDLVSGQIISLVLRLRFGVGIIGRILDAEVRVADQGGVFAAASPSVAPVGLTWTYADAGAVTTQTREVEVDRAVASLQVGHVRQQAIEYNRAGQYGLAREAVYAVQAQVADFAGSDTVLRQVVDDLSMEAAEMAAPMPELDRKARHFASSSAMRSRTADGKAITRD